MNKLLINFSNRLWVLFMQYFCGFCMQLHMARVTKNDQVIKAVVSFFFWVARSISVNVVHVRAIAISAFNALKVVAAKCAKIVFVAVPSNKLCEGGTSSRAIKLIRGCFCGFGIANSTSKSFAATLTMFLMMLLNWMKRRSAFSTRYGVKPRLGSFMNSLAFFASGLKFMVRAKLRRADRAIAHFKWGFHAPIISAFGGKA
jgi:hypothetical protein